MIEVLAALATVVLGLFAGSLLTEALLLVPYFRSCLHWRARRRRAFGDEVAAVAQDSLWAAVIEIGLLLCTELKALAERRTLHRSKNVVEITHRRTMGC